MYPIFFNYRKITIIFWYYLILGIIFCLPRARNAAILSLRQAILVHFANRIYHFLLVNKSPKLSIRKREEEKRAFLPFLLFSLFYLNLLLHINELLVRVIELILQESEFLRGDYLQSESILHLPPAFKGYKALIDIGRNVWMDVQIKFLNANLID